MPTDAEPFDVPDAIGALHWSHGWRDRSGLADRIMGTFFATVLIGGGLVYGLHMLAGGSAHDKLPLVVGIPLVLTAIASFVVFGPDRHCMCVGERGLSVSRRRFSMLTSREVMLFDEADDVEIESTRVVSDAVSQIYTRTELTFSWIDREGYEVFATTGTIDEPSQRDTPKYNPAAPLQLDGSRDWKAAFGFAAMDAFRAFKDQRPIGPYR